MSGGVGPTYGDITLPKEQQHPLNPAGKPISGEPHRRRSFPTFWQVNSLAIIIILSASGMVSIGDMSFVVFSFIYIYFLSKFAFPSPNPSQPPPPVFQNRLLGIYVTFAAIIGLLLPIIYIFHGVFEGDKEGIKAAAPHMFLLASQVFMEGVTLYGRFSIPIRAFVPVFYNTKRIFTIVEWLRSEVDKGLAGGYDERLGFSSERRLYVGRGLAVANLVLWCYNLFGFLVPVYLPRAFKMYYGGNSKVKA